MTKTPEETAAFIAERREWFHHELKTAVLNGDEMEIEYNASRLTFWIEQAKQARK